jgi:NAD(P)-dependent dehydrogenase (short-subunit alcohol dehydrogenase family)
LCPGDGWADSVTDPSGPPKKPNLKTMDINLTGLLYTVKLAIHYFRRQPIDASRDRCLILKSSLAGYVDVPGSIQYNSSKFGVRGVMRSLRRTLWKESIRVNLVAPW